MYFAHLMIPFLSLPLRAFILIFSETFRESATAYIFCERLISPKILLQILLWNSFAEDFAEN